MRNMPSWWGKSSSKEAKKKAGKESFIDSLHRKFNFSSESRLNSRSGGSRRNCNDTISEKGCQSPIESISPSPSKNVSRCQSFAERTNAQPLPLPGLHVAHVARTDSGISISTKPRLEKGSKPLSFLPLPRPACIGSRSNRTDVDGDMVTDSVFSESSGDSDDPADSSCHHSPQATDDNGTRTAAGSPCSVMLNVAPVHSREPKKPANIFFNNHVSPTSPKRRQLGSHVPNLQVPYNGAVCSAPDSSMSSPSRSPMRAFGTEQVVNSAFWAAKTYPDVTLLGSGHCSSPGSGHNSGHNSMGGDMSGQLFWQQSRGSPEYSPVPSPRMTSPGPGSRIHSGAVTPTHPRAGGTPNETQTSWADDGKQQSHRLPLPPVNASPLSHSNSAATSPSVPRSPGRAENPPSPGSRWKKGKLLGRGTFGHVYVGFNSESGEMCAMKEVTLFSDDAKSKESAKQLNQEIALLSRLRHPNIVQYYGSESVDDKLYIYLEYVSGGSIYKLLQDYGQFGELAIRSYTKQILSGLAYLHAKNTVHRDIKGANILVDPSGRVKLADFGMAKHITGQSCPLSFKGSPYWMAPEVIKNSSGANLAVDIWSLGCTVLEMATTKPPWSQYEGVAAMFKIGNSKELPAIPDSLLDDGKDFIRQCLQRNPLHRPTAAQLLEHPFVKYAAPLERSMLGLEPSDPPSGITNGVKALGIGQGRNFSNLDSDRLAIHSSRHSKTNNHTSEIHIPRNISCPVSPIGSPLLHSRSPPRLNGRMSPSPISSPRTTSGSSTPLTGGSGAITFIHMNQPINLQEGFGGISKPSNGLYVNGPSSYHDSCPDMFRGKQPGSHIFSELMPCENDVLGKQFVRPAKAEQYDGQSVLADRVSRQLLKDHVKMNLKLDLSPNSPLPNRTNGVLTYFDGPTNQFKLSS
ncbi:mitogen-activated protein kinase kinase kinase YODA-like [Pyrus ussuriensis x Pyrus communis]|uniref:mitogen-activated protein kinase kinase kinase n=1 Tax=Pyrus ussuriensis x Pyrus communis TaxID=2448454 RepID=A0A5N5FBN3_9ROSA|nr:mitogen-activated protein kinase kinase kinase YODA-like [Pyrus ussuriensis x Pyrus communis]